MNAALHTLHLILVRKRVAPDIRKKIVIMARKDKTLSHAFFVQYTNALMRETMYWYEHFPTSPSQIRLLRRVLIDIENKVEECDALPFPTNDTDNTLRLQPFRIKSFEDRVPTRHWMRLSPL